MIGFILKRLLGSRNEREIKKLFSVVEKINTIEESLQSLTESELINKTQEFQKRINDGNC